MKMGPPQGTEDQPGHPEREQSDGRQICEEGPGGGLGLDVHLGSPRDPGAGVGAGTGDGSAPARCRRAAGTGRCSAEIIISFRKSLSAPAMGRSTDSCPPARDRRSHSPILGDHLPFENPGLGPGGGAWGPWSQRLGAPGGGSSVHSSSSSGPRGGAGGPHRGLMTPPSLLSGCKAAVTDDRSSCTPPLAPRQVTDPGTGQLVRWPLRLRAPPASPTASRSLSGSVSGNTAAREGAPANRGRWVLRGSAERGGRGRRRVGMGVAGGGVGVAGGARAPGASGARPSAVERGWAWPVEGWAWAVEG